MAYVFDQTNNQLDNSQGDGKQNIFQNTGPSDQNQAAGQNPQGQDVKTSTEGSLDTTKSTGGSSTPTAGGGGGAGQSGATGGQRQDVFNKQAQEIKTPGALGNVQSNVAKANSDLQNEANTYEQSAGAKDYTGGVNAGDITNAIVQGSNDAYSKVAGVLNQANPNVEGFAPKTDYRTADSDVRNLNTQAGLQDLMKKEQGAYYTPQEAAFDARLLGKNTGFQQTNQALQAQNKQLQDYATSLYDPTAGAQAVAQQNANNAWAQQKQGLQGQVQGYQDQVVNDLKAKALAASQNMPQGQALQDIISQQIATEMAKQKAGYSGENTFTGRALNNLSQDTLNRYVDPLTGKQLDFSQYVTPNQIDPTQQAGWGQFANQDQVNQFNRVLGLLGTGGQQLVMPQTPYSPYNVNTSGLDTALTNAAMGQERLTENDAQSQIQRILDDAAAQAQSFNKTAQMGANNPELLKRAEAQLNGAYSPEQIKAAEGVINPNDYYTAGRQANADQFITPEQISKLRGYGQTLGEDPGKYQVSPLGTPQGDDFRSGAYADALRQWLVYNRPQPAVSDTGAGVNRAGNIISNPQGLPSQLQPVAESLGHSNTPTGIPVLGAASGDYGHYGI